MDKFLNCIDLECEEIRKIDIKAYQLDNKGRGEDTIFGLKTKLKLDRIKSCDYFLYDNNKLLIIEISDFFRQLEFLKELYSEVKKCNLSNFDKVKKYVSPSKIIKDEIKNKYLNTLLILSFCNEVDINNEKILFLIFCIKKNEDAKALNVLGIKLKKEIIDNVENELKNLVNSIIICPSDETKIKEKIKDLDF